MDYFNNNILPYSATPIVISGLQFLYDKGMYSYNTKQAGLDSIITLGSLLLSKVMANAFIARLVGRVDNYYSSNFTSVISEPLFNVLFYSVGYQIFKKYSSGYKEKSDMSLIYISLTQSIISMLIDRWVLSWISGSSSMNQYNY
ncbi:hypothetical protein ABPG72_016888 [Tetrahymena utriculariae]